MKFRRGAWLWESGVTPACMKRVTEYAIAGDSLFFCGVENGNKADVDKFEGTVLQVRVTSPMADVIRVQVRHHHPSEQGVRKFDLDYGLKAPGVRVEHRGDEHVVFTSGKLALRVRVKNG